MIGKTNSQTGGAIKGEKLNISLLSNQASHTDLLGAIITVTHPGGTTQYPWEGYEITVDIPPYVDYSVEFSEVEGYATPTKFESTAVADNSRTITGTYNTTVMTASIGSNQTDKSDVANATVTIGGKALKNGESAKFATGTDLTAAFSAVTGYATPASQSITASGTAMTVSGTYQTEVVNVTLNADNDESMAGQTVTINGTSHAWNENVISQKIPFGTSYSVSVNDKEDYITPSVQSFTANTATRTVVMTYAYNPATDLSRIDIHGNAIAQSSANCYVVKEAGKYQFPIAYGAAIKNDAVNTEAFTNNGGANSHDFVNYLGNVISSPYVEVDTAKTAASVQMSISDTENAVTDLEIVERSDCRYVQFSVPSVPATGGNAVISVKDADGTIMWSWHIWLWADDLTPVSIVNSTNVTYEIFPVNLASKWDDDAHTYIKNWFYQFGRPNPMLCPAAYNSNENHASYGELSFDTADVASDYHTGIKNPQILYMNSTSPYNWFGTLSYYNLWDAACVSSGRKDNDVVKTVYDPSPVGFKMPNGNTFTYFSTSNVVGSFANGWKFKRYSGDTTGVFFPASGYRAHGGGVNLVDIGSQGMVWNSATASDTLVYHLSFKSNVVNTTYGSYRARGFSVRPVKDSDLALPTHKLTIDVSGDTQTPSGYTITGYQVVEGADETTGEATETLGEVLFTQTTANATHEITWGVKYKVVCSDVDGFVTPASQTYTADQSSRNLSFVYVASALKVNILSNQTNDATIAAVKAVVAYGDTTLEVGNGKSVNVPSGTSGTVTFPEVEGYLTPDKVSFTHSSGITEVSGTYQCELLTVNVTADEGSVSGYEIKIAKGEALGNTGEYESLSYIESDGTNAIAYGFNPINSKIIIHGYVGALTEGSIFGGTDEAAYGATGIGLMYDSTNGFTFYYGQDTSGKSSKAAGSFSYSEFLIETDKNVCNILLKRDDGTESSCKITATSGIDDGDGDGTVGYATIFGTQIQGASPSDFTLFRLYSIKVYDGDTLYQDWRPALKNDGKIGIYDMVGGEFRDNYDGNNFTYDESSVGGIIAVQTTASGTYKIPFDTVYRIEASEATGYKAPSDIVRTASAKSYIATMQYIYSPVKDLSKFDVHGNAINQTTANCYVVKEAGDYMIPIAYGAALKNGQVNTAAYTNNGGSYSHNFVNYLGNAITSPYVETDTGAVATTVQMSISDTENAVTDLSIVQGDGCRYIQFTVPDVPATGANAVISVKDASGVIMWNWHIWLWADDLTPVEITNSTSVAYNIMPVNLASKWDDDAHTYIKNWFYQFGRPTPLLCPSAYNSSSNHASYGALGFATASIASNLYTGIQNPTTFYKYSSSYNYNWFSTNSGKSYNLWDAACTSTGNSDNDVVKTVYDPSPVGFKMPNGNTFTGLSIISSANGIVKMARYSGDTTGVEFPMSGGRFYSGGFLDDVGSYGFVWLSSARSQSNAYHLRFYSGDVDPQDYDYRAYGFSGRPVQE